MNQLDDAQIAGRVRDLMAYTLDVAPGRLSQHARLGEDLCIDSLAATELALVLEDEFGVSLPDELRAEVRTVGDVVNLVIARVRGRGLDQRAG